MVVALYRSNQDAFINGNLNLVRAGRVLRVPAPDAAAAIGQTEARQVLATQGQAWLAYRNELARGAVQSPAVDKDSAQSASGQVSTTAKPPARQAGDRVRLGADAGKGTAPAGDDAAARARELNKLNADLAAVEKNIKDLQKLQTLKSDTLARAEKGAAEKGAAANSAKPAEKGAEKAPAAATPSATAAAVEGPDGRLHYGVKGRYDPGYGSTSRMLSETGMALLACGAPGGIGTPGAILGAALVERLRAHAEIRFEPET